MLQAALTIVGGVVRACVKQLISASSVGEYFSN